MFSRVGTLRPLNGRNRYAGPLAGFLLASVILMVFFVLQDYGPESAIRRFHAAVESNDLADLQRVTQQPITSKSSVALRNFVIAMRTRRASYQLLRVERQPREVYAAVSYSLPNGEHYATVWVINKPDANWQVDSARTVTILRDTLFRPVSTRRPAFFVTGNDF